MNFRSIVLGLLGASFICGFTYFNDFVLDQTFLVGNHFPLSVFGSLIIFLLFNFAIFKLNKRLALTGREFAVIIGMTLVACSIPSSGLMRTLPAAILMPQYHKKTRSGWQRSRIVDEVMPRQMLVDTWKEAATGTLTGASEDDVTLGPITLDKNTISRMKIRIISGKGKKQVRRIIYYDSATGRAEVDAPWLFMPEAGDQFTLSENNEAEVLIPYLEGQQSTGDEGISGGVFVNSIIPWQAWKRPLLFWIPLLLGLWVAIVGLSLVVHKQWAEHEHLPYPISSIISTLLPEEGAGLSGIMKDRKFQIACSVVFLIYMSNYVNSWVPEYWPKIPLQLDFGPIVWHLKLKDGWAIARPTIYFSVIAIAYFLATDVSFSLGLSSLVSTVVFSTVLVSYGINMENGYGNLIRNRHFMTFGAYLGIACIIIYTGRFYYLNVAKKTFGLKCRDELPASSIWGARSLLAGSALFIIMLLSIGISWPIAILYTLLLLLMFLVMGRIIAETGLFFIQAGFLLPSAMIIGLFGARSIGPEMIAALFLLGIVLALDPRECLMPFVMNSLRLFDFQKIKLSRGVFTLGIALIVGLAVTVPATLFYQYKYGASSMNSWTTQQSTTFAFENAIRLRAGLEAKDALKESMQYSALERLTRINPLDSGFLVWLAVGFVLSLGLSICRLKFSKWPLHPIIFLVLSTYALKCFWFSFLLGWAVKVAVTRFGGSKVYRNLKPLVIGMVAGELLGALVPVIIGLIYYFITKNVPEGFRVFPF